MSLEDPIFCYKFSQGWVQPYTSWVNIIQDYSQKIGVLILYQQCLQGQFPGFHVLIAFVKFQAE